MRAEEIRPAINRLELAEKLLLVENVWDSIALGNSELSLPEWQKKELDNRYKGYKGREQNLHDWKSVHEDLRSNHK